MQRNELEQYEYRPIVFASTGVMRGVFGAGNGRAFERRKLNHVFTHTLGTSTGAASGLFMLGDQMRECIDLYWTEARSDEFVSFRRVLTRGGPIQNARYLCEAFRRRLNLEAFYASPVEFAVGVTCAITGEGRFLNAKRPDMHPVDLVLPSISIPGLCGGPVYVDGHPYYDGAGAMGMPTREIIEQYAPTDLLIFPNCASEKKGGAAGQLVNHALLRNEPKLVRKAFLSRHERFADGVQYLRKQNKVRWAIIWGDRSVGQYERNPDKLQATADRADAFMERLLAEAEAYVNTEFLQPLAAQ